MKNILDKGFMKLNPNLIKNTMLHVLQKRQEKVFGNDNGKKPIKIVPKTVTSTTYKRRPVRTSNAV